MVVDTESGAAGDQPGAASLVRMVSWRRWLWSSAIVWLPFAHGTVAPSQSTPAPSFQGGALRRGMPAGIVDDPVRRELSLRLESVDLPAGAMAGMQAGMHMHGMGAMRQPHVLAVPSPIDGWLQGYTVSVEDREGRAVPRDVVHHVNLITPGKRELFSPIMLRIGAAGSETAPVRLPSMLGYRVHRGDTILVTAMMHNPTSRAYNGAQIVVRFPYTPADSWVSRLSIYPFYLDVMPPAGKHAYDLPPGRSSKSWEGSPAVPGRILGMGGHLHKYGTALRLEDVTTKELLWESRPSLDADGDVAGMPTQTFLSRLGLQLRADHVYRLTAVYDNPTGCTIPDGAMGALGGIFLPARGAIWPAVDRRDSTYQVDVRVTYDTSDEQNPSMSGHDHGDGMDNCAASHETHGG